MLSGRISRVYGLGRCLVGRQCKSLAVLSKQQQTNSRTLSTSTANCGILKSPFPDVIIPENTNIAHYVMNEFPKYGDKIAFVEGTTGREITYAQLTDQIAKVGSALVKQGFQKGDVITIFSPNVPEFATMYLAVAAIGGVVSAVNPLYTAGELQHALSHSESKLLVTIPELMPIARAAADKVQGLKGIVTFGTHSDAKPFSSFLDDDMTCFPRDNNVTDGRNETCSLPYSSGTTGLPKGVMLTHENIIANLKQLVTPYVMDYSDEEVLLAVLPFFHIYGQVVVMLSGLVKGLKQVTMPKFDPELYLKNVQDHRGSFLHIVPPIVLFLAKHPMVDKYDLSSVRTFFTGAAPVGAQSVAEAVERLPSHPSFRQGYGLTEASPVTHCNPPDNFKYHSIGTAIHNMDFKILDIETGKEMGPMEEGELCVRGPNVMKGYFKNPEATAHTIRDGWLHTGDIGYYDEDEHVVISDRLKELIKYKGFQVAPAELEALLVTHPAISDAAVIGKPDERAGELPRAYVVLKAGQALTEEGVKAFVKEKMASYKQLAGGVEFLSEIPKSAAGKILRRNLKEKLLKEG